MGPTPDLTAHLLEMRAACPFGSQCYCAQRFEATGDFLSVAQFVGMDRAMAVGAMTYEGFANDVLAEMGHSRDFEELMADRQMNSGMSMFVEIRMISGILAFMNSESDNSMIDGTAIDVTDPMTMINAVAEPPYDKGLEAIVGAEAAGDAVTPTVAGGHCDVRETGPEMAEN